MEVRGGVIQGWDQFDPYHIYGARPAGATNGDAMPGIERSAGPSLIAAGVDKPWHPDSPLFWFGVVLATTLGLIGASTSIRVGPFKAAVAAGKS